MKEEQARETAVPELIDLELTADKTSIERGEPVTVRWHARGDALLTYWESAGAALETDNLDWHRIRELGEAVETSGRREFTPEETTACFLTAWTPFGFRAEKLLIEVREERREAVPTGAWSPRRENLGRMEARPYVRHRPMPRQFQPEMLIQPLQMVLRWAQPWQSGGGPPGISVSPSNTVIFEDESVTVTWNVTNATCANPGYGVTHAGLTAGSICGTQLDGGSIGSAGYPACVAMSGSATFPQPPIINTGHIVLGVSALNSAQSASQSVWIDVLSEPQFKGNATASRMADVKAAIRNIDKNLRGGCIYNDATLDTTVAAFKNGQIKRQAFWWRLLVELENLKLDTFDCQDVADAAWVAGRWYDYSNDIILQWSPKHSPNLEYVILHELVHKCGFNHALPYSDYDVETQTDLVASSCYP